MERPHFGPPRLNPPRPWVSFSRDPRVCGLYRFMRKNVRVFYSCLAALAAVGLALSGCSDGPAEEDFALRSAELEYIEGQAAAAMVAELEMHLGPEAVAGFGERESAAAYSNYLIELAAQCPSCEEIIMRAGRPVPNIDGVHYGLGFLDSADTGLTCQSDPETAGEPPDPTTAGGTAPDTDPPDTDPPDTDPPEKDPPCFFPFDTCPEI